MRHLIATLIVLLSTVTVAALELAPCRIGDTNLPIPLQKAECAQLAVPENHDVSDGRTITLSIAVIKTQTKTPQPDPVLMLAGGPGQSAIEAYSSVAHGFRHILKTRDVILIDQRGTGQSNALNCQSKIDMSALQTDNPQLTKQAVKHCLQQIDADVAQYTTSQSILDFELVRQALGIEQWNLLGISYGTRKALTYVTMFEDSLKAVILDGVVPQQEILGLKHEQNLQSALTKIFTLCSLQPSCQTAFANIEQKMWQMLNNVDKNSIEIVLMHPKTGQYNTVVLNRANLATAIRMLSYSPQTMQLLPFLINQAYNGEYQPLMAQAQMIEQRLMQSLSMVQFSVLCAEDLPFLNSIPTLMTPNLLGDMLGMLQQICQVWPHRVAAPTFKQPVTTDLPILLLSGELDPVTPPQFATDAMQSLTNAQHIVAKGQGHNIFPAGCMPKLIAEFLDSPDQKIADDCLQNFSTPAFFINTMGPKQ